RKTMRLLGFFAGMLISEQAQSGAGAEAPARLPALLLTPDYEAKYAPFLRVDDLAAATDVSAVDHPARRRGRRFLGSHETYLRKRCGRGCHCCRSVEIIHVLRDGRVSHPE